MLAETLGHYRILRPLGKGGMGEVYAAQDTKLGRAVALKVLPQTLGSDPARRERFEREARTVAALNHPHIVTIHSVEEADGVPFLTMELIEGQRLLELIPPQGMALDRFLQLAIPLADAVSAAHKRGIVHRDLKPANVMVTEQGQLKVLDFGLAKLKEAALPGEEMGSDVATWEQTGEGRIVGTAAYMSPEQAEGKPVDARSDVFSLGIVIYEMTTGRRPFQGDSSAGTLSSILKDTPVSVSELRPELPSEVSRIIRRCLEKDPARRMQTALDLRNELEDLKKDSGSTRPPITRSHRNWWPVIAAIVLMVGVGASSLLPRRERPTNADFSVVPFTAYPGEERAPSFSPDGSQIAFAWSSEPTSDQVDLYTKVIGSEQVLRLTTLPAAWITPAWSPDGRSIAFARMAREGSGIYLVAALGGPVRKLADVPFDYPLEMKLGWSPDGKVLAFAEGPPQSPWAVSLLELATLKKQRLDHPAAQCAWSWMPEFSPDGTLLARGCLLSIFVNEVFVGPVSGGTPRRVAHVNGDLSGFAWTGDGKSLVVAADGNLTRVRVDGSTPEKLLFGRDVETPAISRDGHRLAYAQRVVNTDLWRVPLLRSPGGVGKPAPIITSSRMDLLPAYSPDGRRLAFSSYRSGAPEIWTSDADGSNLRQLTSFGGPLTGTPRWSPDGRTIAFDSRPRGQSDIYLVDAEGGAPLRLETGRAGSEVPFWSPDGKWIYFSTPVESGAQVYKVPLQGGQATQLTTRGGSFPQVAPDGRRIYYWSEGKDEAIWSVSFYGGDERPVSGMSRLPPECSGSWAVDASGIYFLEPGPRPSVMFLEYTKTRARRIADLPGAPESWGGTAVSPDGRTLLFSRVEQVVSDIMLVEGFR